MSDTVPGPGTEVWLSSLLAYGLLAVACHLCVNSTLSSINTGITDVHADWQRGPALHGTVSLACVPILFMLHTTLSAKGLSMPWEHLLAESACQPDCHTHGTSRQTGQQHV